MINLKQISMKNDEKEKVTIICVNGFDLTKLKNLSDLLNKQICSLRIKLKNQFWKRTNFCLINLMLPFLNMRIFGKTLNKLFNI